MFRTSAAAAGWRCASFSGERPAPAGDGRGCWWLAAPPFVPGAGQRHVRPGADIEALLGELAGAACERPSSGKLPTIGDMGADFLGEERGELCMADAAWPPVPAPVIGGPLFGGVGPLSPAGRTGAASGGPAESRSAGGVNRC
ncbi:unnamed protein product [Prorocentrum cordatum]|uniref:Uncharacterized protein n=1 Tax=Prorocentrum cordatum TaxID=2364126 RepID=A0ABN9XJ37_9DINO|nr:unnamed protein product [Polarella glacialis]